MSHALEEVIKGLLASYGREERAQMTAPIEALDKEVLDEVVAELLDPPLNIGREYNYVPWFRMWPRGSDKTTAGRFRALATIAAMRRLKAAVPNLVRVFAEHANTDDGLFAGHAAVIIGDRETVEHIAGVAKTMRTENGFRLWAGARVALDGPSCLDTLKAHVTTVPISSVVAWTAMLDAYMQHGVRDTPAPDWADLAMRLLHEDDNEHETVAYNAIAFFRVRRAQERLLALLADRHQVNTLRDIVDVIDQLLPLGEEHQIAGAYADLFHVRHAFLEMFARRLQAGDTNKHIWRIAMSHWLDTDKLKYLLVSDPAPPANALNELRARTDSPDPRAPAKYTNNTTHYMSLGSRYRMKLACPSDLRAVRAEILSLACVKPGLEFRFDDWHPGAAQLAELITAHSWEEIDLRGNGPPPDLVIDALCVRTTSTLAALHINALSRRQLRQLCRAPSLANLRLFHLSDTPLGPAVLDELTAATFWPNLWELQLDDVELRDDGLAALERTTYPTALQSVRVWDSAVEDSGGQRIAEQIAQRGVDISIGTALFPERLRRLREDELWRDLVSRAKESNGLSLDDVPEAPWLDDARLEQLQPMHEQLSHAPLPPASTSYAWTFAHDDSWQAWRILATPLGGLLRPQDAALHIVAGDSLERLASLAHASTVQALTLEVHTDVGFELPVELELRKPFPKLRTLEIRPGYRGHVANKVPFSTAALRALATWKWPSTMNRLQLGPSAPATSDVIELLDTLVARMSKQGKSNLTINLPYHYQDNNSLWQELNRNNYIDGPRCGLSRGVTTRINFGWPN